MPARFLKMLFIPCVFSVPNTLPNKLNKGRTILGTLDLANCEAKTLLAKVVPKTCKPVVAAFSAADSMLFVLQKVNAKAATAEIPSADAQLTTLFLASNFNDSMVPAFARFLACLYVRFPCLIICCACLGLVTPGTLPCFIFSANCSTASAY